MVRPPVRSISPRTGGQPCSNYYLYHSSKTVTIIYACGNFSKHVTESGEVGGAMHNNRALITGSVLLLTKTMTY